MRLTEKKAAVIRFYIKIGESRGDFWNHCDNKFILQHIFKNIAAQFNVDMVAFVKKDFDIQNHINELFCKYEQYKEKLSKELQELKSNKPTYVRYDYSRQYNYKIKDHRLTYERFYEICENHKEKCQNLEIEYVKLSEALIELKNVLQQIEIERHEKICKHMQRLTTVTTQDIIFFGIFLIITCSLIYYCFY